MPELRIVSKTQLIEDFGLEILQGRGALFIGSGLSTGKGRYPTWEALLKPLREIAKVPHFTNYPLMAEYIISNLLGGRKEFEALLLERLQISDVTPSPTQELLAALPVRDWWTTNYDCLLEATGVDFDVVQKDGLGLGAC